MNLYHVQREESWKHAEKACRSEFIEAMRDFDYGASETREAWGWFVLGWYKGGGIPKRPVSA